MKKQQTREAAKYLRDLAQRLMDYPTEHYKEAYEALIGYADETESDAPVASQSPAPLKRCPACEGGSSDDCPHADAPALPRAQDWQPIETAPRQVTRALLYWPTFAVGDDGEQTTVRCGDGLVAESFRVGANQWENDLVTEHFEDEAGFGYGDPTRWMPLPSPPSVEGVTDPARDG